MTSGGAWRRPAFAFLLVAVCAAVVPAWGCGGKARPLDRIQYWNGFVGPDGNITEPIVRDFEARSGLRVQVQKMPWDTYFDKLIAAIAAGDPPDVFVLHMSELPAYAHMGALLPLDAYVDREDFVPLEDRVTEVWDRCRYQGRLYGVPIDVHLLGLYYNKDYFDRAGLPYPDETRPLSGAELIHLARRLTVDENGDGRPEIWGFSFSGAPFMYFTAVLAQFDGAVLSPDLTEPAIDSPEAREALTWMRDLVARHGVAPPPEGLDTWQAFVQGRIAMITEGCWILNGLGKYATFRWGAAPFFVAGRRPAVWATGHVVCVSRTLPPERLPNALALAKHLSDTGVTWSTSGMIPTRHSQLASAEFQAETRMAPFVTQIDALCFEPPSPAGIELRDRYQQSVFSALAGLKSVEAALAEADRRMKGALIFHHE